MESPYWRRCAGIFVVHDKPSTAGVGREGFLDLSLLGGPARPLPVQQVGGAGVWAARQHDLARSDYRTPRRSRAFSRTLLSE